MNLPYMLGVLENPYPEGILYIILDILHVVIGHTAVLPQHLIYNKVPEVTLNVVAAIFYRNLITARIQTI